MGIARTGANPGGRIVTARGAVFPAMVLVVAVGLWIAIERTKEVGGPERLGTFLAITIPLALWLGLIPIVWRTRAYLSQWFVPLGLLLPPTIGLFLLSRLPHLTQLLQAIPSSWLIGFLVYRFLGGIVWLRALNSREVERRWFNASAGSLDAVVGATAIPVALLVVSGGSLGIVIGVTWNVIGLLDFAFGIILDRIPRGGPGYMISLSTPTLTALRQSILGIVVFAAPLSIIVHVLSLWQLLSR